MVTMMRMTCSAVRSVRTIGHIDGDPNSRT